MAALIWGKSAYEMNATCTPAKVRGVTGFDPFVLVAMLLGLILFVPLFQPGLPAAPDAMLHFFRTALWRWAWEDGVIWPRWHTLLYQGYGYPAFNFNGPFFYAVAAFLACSPRTS